MDLSLSEAARLLGKTDRQMRYLVCSGEIPARKDKGRWRIHRDDLPLGEGQERAQRQKDERAARLAEEILRPAAKGSKKGFSVREIRAYREGAPIYRQIVAEVGAEHPSVVLLREAFMLLACGYHEFEGDKKALLYAEARHQASRAAMVLLLDGEEKYGELVGQLETILLPAVGGLIHQAEKRGHGGSRRRS